MCSEPLSRNVFRSTRVERQVQLDKFNNPAFDRGRPAWMEALWLAAQWLFVSSWLPGSRHRRFLLHLFGARIGEGFVAKPGVKVKFPWKLEVGDHVWLGEGVWIDNLDQVRLGSHVCVSQGAYLCTGSHNWTAETFDLVTRPIVIEDQTWIGAKAMLAPGTIVREGAVLSLGSVAKGELQQWTVYVGNPARAARERHEGHSGRRPTR